MATIKQQGKGYKITVSRGYDINGKQFREHMTWVPSPGMTKRQIEKELNRQAVLFEEQIKASGHKDGNIRFIDFVEIFFNQKKLRKQTIYNYKMRLKDITQAIGHIKLKDIKRGHIIELYNNLQEDGMRARSHALVSIDFQRWLKDRNTNISKLSRDSGISTWTLRQMRDKKPIALKNAEAVAAYINVPLRDIFEVERDMRPLEPATIHSYHRTLSSILAYAVQEQYISENPASNIKLPQIKSKPTYLDEPDIRKFIILLQNEPIKWRTIVMFDLLSGLRRAELCGLEWSDINVEANSVKIRHTSNYLPEYGIYDDDTKTESSERYLRVTETAISLLLVYKKWQDEQKHKLGDAWENNRNKIFTTDTGAPIHPSSISHWMSQFIKRSGLPKITLHSLRHTYASIMIADGVPLVAVADQLGHAKPSTTNNIYAHVIAESKAKAAETLNKFNDVIKINTK